MPLTVSTGPGPCKFTGWVRAGVAAFALLCPVSALAQVPGGAVGIAEEARLDAQSGWPSGAFGASVAIDGNLAVVGAPGEDVGSPGHALLFERVSGMWVPAGDLTATDGQAGDRFGWSVAINGDTIAVGAPYHDVNGQADQGAVYVFRRAGSMWVLTASDGEEGDLFGSSVALFEGTVVVGAEGHGQGPSGPGAAYVFSTMPSPGFLPRTGPWTEYAKLTDPDGHTGERFGHSVAVSGTWAGPSTVLVGAPHRQVGAADSQGAAFVFAGYPGGMTEQAKLTASDGGAIHYFGWSVAIDGDTALVGAHYYPPFGRGAAYAYQRTAGTWTEQARLTAADGQDFDWFGVSVALRGDLALVGAYGVGSAPGSVNSVGAVYPFTRIGATWSGHPRLLASSGTPEDWFGAALAFDRDTFIVGAPGRAVGGVPRVGVAYVFTVPRDGDNDTLPDRWERQWGLSPDSASADDGPLGDPDTDGLTNTEEYAAGTHPRGFYRRYLAEGATISPFDLRLALLNPEDTPTTGLLRFLLPTGGAIARPVPMPRRSRATLEAKQVPGLEAAEFSTVLESSVPLVLDRTMTWDATGYGSHAESAVPAPATVWYFAEGATIAGFQLFYLLQNPDLTDAAQVRVRYLRSGGLPPLEKTYTVGPNTRQNIWVNLEAFDTAEGPQPLLAAAEFSARLDVLNGVPVIAERAMYLNAAGQLFGAGHASAAIPAPSTSWFLAEGATGPYFDLFVLLANPGPQAANLELTYLLPDGRTIVKPRTLPANSRDTIWVDQEDPDLADTAVSTIVHSTNDVPIVVERAMWWPGPTAVSWLEAHNSPGSTMAGTKWALAEGEVGGVRNTQTYILIANTSPFEGSAVVTLYLDGGGGAGRNYLLPPNSRTNVPVGEALERGGFGQIVQGRRFGAVIESVPLTLGGTPAEIVVERAMYSDAVRPGGVDTWAAGTNALATALGGTAPPADTFGKLTPKTSAAIVGGATTLSWQPLAGAISYEYCLDTIYEPVCNTSWVTVGTATSVEVSGLVAGTIGLPVNYYWAVRAETPAGIVFADPYEKWWSFSRLAPPVEFQKANPTNGATSVPLTDVMLQWTWDSDYRYSICLDTVPNNVCDTEWTISAMPTFSLSSLVPETTYFWQVRASNAAGAVEADGGTWWSFTTAANLPGRFEQVSPADSASLVPLPVVLSWSVSAAADTYEYCVGQAGIGAGWSCEGLWVDVGAATSATVSGLSKGIQYYWAVRARNAKGTRQTDTMWLFTTYPDPVTPFGKIAPTAGASVPSDQFTLAWQPSANARLYTYCLDTIDNGACDTGWMSSRETSLFVFYSTPGQIYCWQVRAMNDLTTLEADGGTWWCFTASAGVP